MSGSSRPLRAVRYLRVSRSEQQVSIVFLVPNEGPLNIAGRIMSAGQSY
jgi:hypothetical protein